MENPLGDMPSLPPNNEPPKEEGNMPGVSEEPKEKAPVESIQAPAEEMKDEVSSAPVKEKKPFFTMGKILAIFGVLLIVGTVVGAIIYSQSSERLQGALILNSTTAPAGNAIITNSQNLATGYTMKTQDDSTTTETTSTNSQNLTSGYTIKPQDDSTITTAITPAKELVTKTPLTTELTCTKPLIKQTDANGNDYCMCPSQEYPDTYSSVTGASEVQCLPFDCDLSDAEISKIHSDIVKVVSGDASKYAVSKFDSEYSKWSDKYCQPEVKELECTAPLVKKTDATSGTEYCMCPDQQYPLVTVSNTLTANMPSNIQCLPFTCDLTQEKITKIREDILMILNRQGLDDSLLSSITSEFSADYKAYYDKTCKVEVTCDDLKKDLSAAYYAENWDQYDSVLKQMQEKECLSPCELIFYKAVPILSQNKIEEGRKLIDQYIQTCTDQCTLSYGMLSLYAETLSELEQSVTAAYTISDEDLARLKQLVVKYVENCQCFEIESFLTAPGFPDEDYFVQSSSSAAAGSFSSGLKSTADLNDALIDRLKSDNTVRTAYAQSLSSSVRGVIEDAYNDLCVPDDKPKSCTKLTIQAPSSTGSYQITEDLNPASDYLKFTVDNDELVKGYKISSQTVVFDGDSENITTDKTEVSMDGGPSAGNEDIITVTALEGGSDAITHMDAPKETCSAEIKIIRPPENPPVKQESVCRSLEIVSPGDAAEPGVPTIELTAGEYNNKVLEIKVDADSGSIKDYKYSSANGYITFNGEETLYTSDKTVVMEGVIPEGETETISVWARDPDSTGIQACGDGYIVTVPKEKTPPPPIKKTPPPTTVTEETPPPPIKEIVVPSTPVPEPASVPEPEPEPVHQAAPEAPSTGPGVLIYLLGAGLGGTLISKRKK